MDKQQYQATFALKFPEGSDTLQKEVCTLASSRFSKVMLDLAYTVCLPDDAVAVILSLRAEADGAEHEDIDPAAGLLERVKEVWPGVDVTLRESIRLQSFDVSVLDTEHRTYNYPVYALDEDEARSIAWDQAAENYHGPKQILSVC